MGNTNEPVVVNADPKNWFKKPERPLTPDPEWNECKTVDNKPTQKWLCDLAKAKKPSKKFDDLMSTLIDFSAFAMNRLRICDLTKDIMIGPAYNLFKGTCSSYIELEYNMEECYKALNNQLDLNNPEGNRYPFDLSKPLPLVISENHQIVPVDYFFNNDLAYLQGGSTEKTYTTSITKIKATKYDLPGIEDMVPNLWSPTKVDYNRYALLGTSHWGPKRQHFYGYASNGVSKHDVYSTKRILVVTNVKVNIWRLHLNDIEYMMLLVVQNRLFNLDGDVIMNLAAALRMFTRCIVIQKRVEALQLGVKSYQNKLNISRPLKFSDDTLISVRDKLKDMANNLEIGYTSVMPRRKWSNLDKKRARIMVKDID
ncbi:hypothetical protein Tco_0477173 [Tanacetum coccineum]